MSSPLERQLRDELERRGREADIPPMSRVYSAAVRGGTRLRRRRQGGVLVGASLAVLGVTAAVSAIATDNEATIPVSGRSPGPNNSLTMPSAGDGPDTGRSSSPSPSAKSSTMETTDCKNVPSPPPVEMDTLLDEKEGVLRYSYSDPKSAKLLTFIIAYREDPDCMKDPALRRLINHVLDAADY